MIHLFHASVMQVCFTFSFQEESQMVPIPRVFWSCFNSSKAALQRCYSCRAMSCLHELLNSFFFEVSKRTLSSILVIKPNYPHSLYMVVAKPLCKYLFECIHLSIRPLSTSRLWMCKSPWGTTRDAERARTPPLLSKNSAKLTKCSMVYSEQKPEPNIVSCSLWIKRHLPSCLLEEISPDRSTAISPSWLEASWKHPSEQTWPSNVL